jgi:hypothetical protein
MNYGVICYTCPGMIYGFFIDNGAKPDDIQTQIMKKVAEKNLNGNICGRSIE